MSNTNHTIDTLCKPTNWLSPAELLEIAAIARENHLGHGDVELAVEQAIDMGLESDPIGDFDYSMLLLEEWLEAELNGAHDS